MRAKLWLALNSTEHVACLGFMPLCTKTLLRFQFLHFHFKPSEETCNQSNSSEVE